MTDSLTRAAFARRVRALPGDAFEAFVAELSRHREGTVVVEGDGTPAVGSDHADRGRRLYVHHPEEAPSDVPAAADAVVTPADDPDVPPGLSAVGPGELFDVARYAVPTETGDGVCREFLGGVPRADGPAVAAAGAGAASAGTDSGAKAEETGEAAGTEQARAGADWSPPRQETATHEIDGAGDGGGDETAGSGLPLGGLTVAVAAGVVLFALGFTAGIAVGLAIGPGGASEADETLSGPTAENPTPARIRTAEPTPDRSTTGGAVAGDANGTERYAALEPTCTRPPEQVVAVQVGALRADNGTGLGVETVYQFASPENRRFTGPLENFRSVVRSEPYVPLFEFEEVRYGRPVVDNGTMTQRVTAVENGTESRYEFVLSKQTASDVAGCWMTDGVRALPGPTAGNDTAARSE